MLLLTGCPVAGGLAEPLSAQICGLLLLVSGGMTDRRSDLGRRADEARDRSSGFRVPVPEVDELRSVRRV